MLLPRHWKLHTEETVIADSLQVIPSSIRCKSALLSVRVPKGGCGRTELRPLKEGEEQLLRTKADKATKTKGYCHFRVLCMSQKKKGFTGRGFQEKDRSVKENKDKPFTISTVQEVCRDILIIANVKV